MPTDTKMRASLAAAPRLTLGDTQRPSLCDVLDRVLNKGAVIDGEATISVAGIDLVYLGLRLVLTSIETARRRSQFGAAEFGPANKYRRRNRCMASAEMARMECEGLSACAQVMNAGTPSLGPEAGEGLAGPVRPVELRCQRRQERTGTTGADSG